MAVAIVIAKDNVSVHGPNLVTVHDGARFCKIFLLVMSMMIGQEASRTGY